MKADVWLLSARGDHFVHPLCPLVDDGHLLCSSMGVAFCDTLVPITDMILESRGSVGALSAGGALLATIWKGG